MSFVEGSEILIVLFLFSFLMWYGSSLKTVLYPFDGCWPVNFFTIAQIHQWHGERICLVWPVMRF